MSLSCWRSFSNCPLSAPPTHRPPLFNKVPHSVALPGANISGRFWSWNVKASQLQFLWGCWRCIYTVILYCFVKRVFQVIKAPGPIKPNCTPTVPAHIFTSSHGLSLSPSALRAWVSLIAQPGPFLTKLSVLQHPYEAPLLRKGCPYPPTSLKGYNLPLHATPYHGYIARLLQVSCCLPHWTEWDLLSLRCLQPTSCTLDEEGGLK